MAVNVVLKSVWDDKGIKQAQQQLGQIGNTLGKAFAVVGVAVAAAAAGLVKFGADSIAAAENVQQANNRLAQVAKSMGIFGSETQAVTKRLIDFAEANELLVAVDAEVIKATQAKLLTFKNLAQTADVVGGAMDRATMAALDLAAAGFGSAETNAVQLGKALQDPIKGITALARAGVTFTQVEKDKIRALVESGNVLEAQNLILSAIETQVGGTAQATAKASDRIRLAFDNIAESVGEALLPTFNLFADELVKITPQLEAALAPAAAEVAKIFREQVLPAIQNFTNWLSSPQGTKTLKDLTQAVVDAIKRFIDFVGWVIQNKDAIGAFATGLFIAIGAFKALEIAVQLATAKQLLFNAAVLANPIVAGAALIVAGIGAITTALVIGTNAANDLKTELEKTGQATIKTRGGFVTFAKDANGASKGLDYAINQTRKLGAEAETTANRLARIAGMGAGSSPAAGGPMRAAPKVPVVPTIPSFTGGGAKKETAAEKARKQQEADLKKVKELLANASKEIAAAQKSYADTVARAQAEYAAGVIRIEKDFANRLADVVRQSQQRLRDAFANVVRVSLSDLFEVEETKSVDNLVTGLTRRLEQSRDLIAKAGKLNAEGFSQTFIEQVVSAGVETGNELATAILDATPETRKQLQQLFGEVESVAETGMTSLSKQIYDRAGLATSELKALYAQTQQDQVDALLDLQKTLDEQLALAQTALQESLTGTQEKLNEELGKIKSDISSVKDEVQALIDKLNELRGIKVEVPEVKFPQTGTGTGTGTGGGGGGGKGPVINVTVRTDPTKSAAETGRQVAKVINKYTGAGGGLKIGPAAV